MQQTIVIKNGHVIDPLNGTDEIKSICISEGRFVDESEIKSTDILFEAGGKFVFPGLIDYHAHVFPKSTEIGIDADRNLLNQGVTSVVDPGSAGVSNIQTFIENVINRSAMDIQAYINLCPSGLATMKFHEDFDPKFWDIKKLAYFLQEYPQYLLGLKIRMSQSIFGHLGFEVFEKAIALAEQLHTRLCVHTTDPVGDDMGKVAENLRPGDILAHCYHGTGSTILGRDGHVLPEVREAQARGVVMDAANGGNHWSFATAEAAMADGFYPDVISTDLTCKTLYQDPVFSLPYIMSKYLLLGMPLYDIVKAVTMNPASLMHNKTGSLTKGEKADVAIFALEEKKMTFSDTKKQQRTGERVFVPMLTICKGEVVYRNILF